MIGIAAGLSLCGKNVYCYSIAPFLVMRAFEQVGVDVAYQGLNVKLVGVGGGLGPEDEVISISHAVVATTVKPLDKETIFNSVRKTGRLVIADTGWGFIRHIR